MLHAFLDYEKSKFAFPVYDMQAETYLTAVYTNYTQFPPEGSVL